MAFNMFPHSNLHELNLDWILQTMKEFSDELDAFKTRLDTIRGSILADCKDYTDEAISEQYSIFQQQYNQLLIDFGNFQKSINNTINTFQNQFDAYTEKTTAEVLSAKAYTDVAIELNNEYIFEEISKQAISVKVLNPFTGERIPIQEMVDYLSNFHLTDAIKISTLANRNNTVAQMIAYNSTCADLVKNGANIITDRS